MLAGMISNDNEERVAYYSYYICYRKVVKYFNRCIALADKFKFKNKIKFY